MQLKTLKSPTGASDVYGADCVLKSRTASLTQAVFASWGYSEIETPTFEYSEVFSGGMSIPQSEMIKFIDRGGFVMALRPDMTTAISRAVASHLSDSPVPLRLRYEGSVFRSGESYKSAKKSEFTQAGVELMGASGAEADSEVIALTIEALLATGLKEFQIEMAHASFLQGIIDDCELEEEDEATLKGLLDKKFTFGVEEFCRTKGISERNSMILSSLPSAFGEGEELFKKYASLGLPDASRSALGELREIFDILRSRGLERYITVDLGLVRSFNYYTGVIFRGLASGAAFPVCGGGRYDALGERFNLKLPATGVAIWIDRLADALLRTGAAGDISPSADVLVIFSPEKRLFAYEKAKELRAKGLKVITDVCAFSESEAKESARARNIKGVYSADKEAFI